MPQEDKIKKEIDRIGLVLAKLLSLILNKPDHHAEAASDVIQQAHDGLDLDIHQLLSLSPDELTDYLVSVKKFSVDNLRNFAHLLYEMSRTFDEEHKARYRKQALVIYEYVNTHGDGTVYLDIISRIQEMKQ